MSFEISLTSESPILLVTVSGEVDASTAPQLMDDVMAAVSPEQPFVAMDFHGVHFLSSAGLRALLGILRHVRSLGGDLRLARLQPEVKNVITMGFANMVKTYGSIPGMLAAYYEELGISAPAQSGNRWAHADEFLDKLRLIGDPPADEVIQELFETGQVEAVNRLLRDLFANDHVPSEQLPPVVRRYIGNTIELPRWADSSRIRSAQAVFGRYGMHIGTILYCASLPTAYSARRGVHVLAATQRLSRNPYRRIFETTQMVLDLMQPGGMAPDGMGLRSVQKVRLMHAAIRHLLLARGDWEIDLYGYPINQEDLAGTMLTFSNIVVQSLPKLGIQLSEQEREDYIHIWNVIGSMLGIIPELLPVNASDAANLGAKILERNIEASEDGREIGGYLVQMMHEKTPGGHLHELPEALIRYLSGDEVADAIGVAPTNWERALKPFRWATRLWDETDDRVPLLGMVSEVFIRRLMSAITTHELEGKRTAFRIPGSLQEDLRVAELREQELEA